MMLRSKFSQQFPSLLIPSLQHNCRLGPFNLLLSSIYSFSTASQNRTHTAPPNLNSKNSLLADYLTNSLKFPHNEAIALSKRFPPMDSNGKPEAVVGYLKSLGLSVIQLQSLIKRQASILLADVEKTLKPKVTFYEELGVHGPQLGILISKNSHLLSSSLDKRIKPSIAVIKKVLELHGSTKNNNYINDLMFRILSRYSWVIANDSRLQSNIIYLQSCGIVGSQLIMLLKTELRLFSSCEKELNSLVTRAIEMGFVMGSRMLVYGILALYSNSVETFDRKFKLLQSFDFTRDECHKMFVKAPFLLKRSEATLRHGIEFLIGTLMLDKSVLVGRPILVGLSMEKRIIPRYKLIEMIKSMRLLRKEPRFTTVLLMTHKKLLENYVLRFDNDAKDLQIAYENFLLESSKEERQD
ncbi:hypothetical protein OROGR_017326 [Orobanche gracilis]